jgi:hypothetical protein
LRPTAHDRVASLLVAMLTLVGTVVLLLFGFWAAPKEKDEVVIVYQPELVESGGYELPPSEFEMPDASELPGVPLIQTSALFSARMAEAVAAVTNLNVGGGSGVQEDGRQVGPLSGNDDSDEISRWERWEIRYAADSIDAYAKQLDHFGIELGAAGGGRKNVDYASGFTAPSPMVRDAPGIEDIRLYMTWRNGPLKKFDSTLLQRAGISVDRRILLQFYPAKIEEMLANLEAEHAGVRPIEGILKTIFGIRSSTDDGYEFFVKGQKYR